MKFLWSQTEKNVIDNIILYYTIKKISIVKWLHRTRKNIIKLMSSLLIIGPLLFCLNDAYLRMIKQYDKLFEAIKIINVISFIKKNVHSFGQKEWTI